MAEVVHCNQMDHMQAHFFDGRRRHLCGAAAVAHRARLVNKKVFASCGGQGVYAKDFAVGVERRKLVTRDAAGVERAGQAGGKTDVQDILL